MSKERLRAGLSYIAPAFASSSTPWGRCFETGASPPPKTSPRLATQSSWQDPDGLKDDVRKKEASPKGKAKHCAKT